MPDVPQLEGWKFDKDNAQVQELKDWLPRLHEEGWVSKLDRINNFMLRSNFLSPFVHPKNIAEFWATGRGFDWLHPEGYGRLMRTMPQAVSEVLTMGPVYKNYLREGSALMSGDARTNQFHEMLVNKGGQEITQDPGAFAAIKSAFGDVVKTPAQLYNTIQQASHKAMWMASDMMMMQRVMELQGKGMGVRDAIAKAEEMIPNYRVPAQIMDSPTGGRMLHHLFSNNRLFAIGRYHYNKFAAWGRMFKKIAKGTPEERTEALGQFLVASILGAAVIPAIDKAIQIGTKNPNARVKRGGLLAVPDAVGGVASGREEVPQAIASVLDFSPMLETGVNVARQKNYFGQDATSPYKSAAGNIAGEGELFTDEFGPMHQIQGALRHTYGPERVIGNQFGVDLPKTAPGQVKGKTRKYLKGQAKRQEKNDPFVRGLQSLGVP